MDQKRLRVSIIIPAYNEESYLRQSLESIAVQTVEPFEVIVVDNNSSDKTAEIASEFSFVTLLTQKKQGVVFARDMGFDAARGEIIGRIDADTDLSPNWVEQVQAIFEDETIAAVTGSAHYHDTALNGVIDRVDLALRKWMAVRMKKHMYLWGANMAIRRSAWTKVRGAVCHDGRFHEDLDLAAHLGEVGTKVIFDPKLHIDTSGRRVDVGFPALLSYLRVSPSTYKRHHLGERKYMYPSLFLVAGFYILLRVLYRGYNEKAHRFSLAKVLQKRTTTNRPDPTLLLFKL